MACNDMTEFEYSCLTGAFCHRTVSVSEFFSPCLGRASLEVSQWQDVVDCFRRQWGYSYGWE